jgi:thiamine pyrophosphokinase
MNALIIGAAPAFDDGDFYKTLVMEADLVVAADGAGEWCSAMGRVPDVTVGDFDSALPGAAERLAAAGSEVRELPVDKDMSDLDACVDAARALGATEMTFTAAFSRRMDHTLAAIGTVLRASDIGATVQEPQWWAVASSAQAAPLLLDLLDGTTFTVVSCDGADGVTIRGGRYDLDGARLEPFSSRGLSNVSMGEPVTIHAEQGRLLVIVQR